MLKPDAIKEITGGKGVDVVYDPVGGDYAEPAVRSMAWNGDAGHYDRGLSGPKAGRKTVC